MLVRAFTFAQYHNRPNTGSTKIRVGNLIKYWPELELYKYGEKPDVMIFQKVYMQADYLYPKNLDCIKILDICDPDWFDNQAVKQTIDEMHAVTCPTEPLAEFLRQLTDKPVVVIPDRHDIAEYPVPKKHYDKATKLVWFGYKHNAELLKGAMNWIERNGFELTVISNDAPNLGGEYNFIKYPADEKDFIIELQKHDICILPQGNRPEDRFKSDNKTTKAWLAGLPVAQDAEQIEALIAPEARQKEALACYNKAIKDYDCKLSVKQMQDLIKELVK